MSGLHVVVGSGPSSLGITHALLERGLQVLVLDIGKTIDEHAARIASTMAQQEPEQWSKEDKQLVQRVDFQGDPSIPPKRLFGSAFSYFIDPRIEAPDNMQLYGSHAFGGLSTVWGCALLPNTPSDVSDWPAAVRHGMADAYRQIGALINQDIGVDIFSPGTRLKISPGAEIMLDRFKRWSKTKRVIDLFPTPLAVSDQCIACNACMYGCVYGFTYSSRSTIERVFMKNPLFRYVGGVTVERFRETAAGVEIYSSSGPNRKSEMFKADQLFLAAGMMASLRIVWNSYPEVARVLHARDSSSFLIPGVFPSLRSLQTAKHHGLAQVSVDLKAAPFQNRPAHFQIYINSPAIAEALNAHLGAFAFDPVRAVVRFANRLLIAAQGYLHSDFCNRLRLEFKPTGIIKVSVEHNLENARAIDIALAQFAKEMIKLGAIFLKQGSQIKAYGASRMAGALPHNLAASPTTTDQLGRPAGAKNVFIVDATVLPSIAGRNQTLPMMANALRIGQASQQS